MGSQASSSPPLPGSLSTQSYCHTTLRDLPKEPSDHLITSHLLAVLLPDASKALPSWHARPPKAPQAIAPDTLQTGSQSLQTACSLSDTTLLQIPSFSLCLERASLPPSSGSLLLIAQGHTQVAQHTCPLVCPSLGSPSLPDHITYSFLLPCQPLP